MLDRFAIDFALCMYCGICIEVCPFDALFWTPEFEYAEYDVGDLTHERERLRDWMWTVPAPPGVDPGAEEPKELVAAEKALDKAAEGRRRRGCDPASGPAPGRRATGSRVSPLLLGRGAAQPARAGARRTAAGTARRRCSPASA